MRFAKFGHKFCPQLRSSILQHPSESPQPGARKALVPPCNHLHQKREQLDASFGQTVNGFLFMAGVLRLDDDPLLDEPLKTIGENIRRNPLLRLGQELAKMPAVQENDVADNEQTPLVAKDLDHQVDNAL